MQSKTKYSKYGMGFNIILLHKLKTLVETKTKNEINLNVFS